MHDIHVKISHHTAKAISENKSVVVQYKHFSIYSTYVRSLERQLEAMSMHIKVKEWAVKINIATI